jgi:myo-inositol 2-dehydrogenase / D-chiro-inositol 1-dehydrogenase
VRAVFRLGLVGAGRMGRTHLRALAGSPADTVTAIDEPVAAARASLAGSGARLFEDLAGLLEAGGIDGVLIAAPSDQHVELVARVAAAGLPILCEKPCGLSSRDVAAAAGVAARHGVPLQVAYWRRYVPALQELRARIARSDLGELHLLASYQWDGQPPAPTFRAHSGGIFIDMGVHEFDQIRWLSGQEIGELRAVSSPPIADGNAPLDVDSAQAIAALSGGATAFVSLGRYYPVGDMARIEVFGTRDAASSEFLDPREGDRAQLEALRRQAEGFAEFAAGGPCTGATVADAAAAIDAAERASSQIPVLAATAVGPAS